MSRSACFHLVAVLSLASSLAWAEGPQKPPSPLFPLPSLDGKPLAASEGQKVFRVPLRLARVEQFYRERFAHQPEVTLTTATVEGRRTLTVVSKRKGDAWKKAVVREGEVETVIEITPVLRMTGEQVQGNGRPLVEFVITRSPEASKMAEQIDHLEK